MGFEKHYQINDTSVSSFINTFIPSLYRYLLWAADNNEDPFNPKDIIQSFDEFKQFYNPAMDLDEMTFLNVVDRKMFFDVHDKVKEISNLVSIQVNKIHESRIEILKNISVLEKIVEQDIFNTMSVETVEAFNKWIENVSYFIL